MGACCCRKNNRMLLLRLRMYHFWGIPGNPWVAIDEEHGSCTWGSAPDPEVFQGMGVSSELSDAPVQARMGAFKPVVVSCAFTISANSLPRSELCRSWLSLHPQILRRRPK